MHNIIGSLYPPAQHITNPIQPLFYLKKKNKKTNDEKKINSFTCCSALTWNDWSFVGTHKYVNKLTYRILVLFWFLSYRTCPMCTMYLLRHMPHGAHRFGTSLKCKFYLYGFIATLYIYYPVYHVRCPVINYSCPVFTSSCHLVFNMNLSFF